jgi:hypothetical protein
LYIISVSLFPNKRDRDKLPYCLVAKSCLYTLVLNIIHVIAAGIYWLISWFNSRIHNRLYNPNLMSVEQSCGNAAGSCTTYLGGSQQTIKRRNAAEFPNQIVRTLHTP